jgi:hypothetical protein
VGFLGWCSWWEPAPASGPESDCSSRTFSNSRRQNIAGQTPNSACPFSFFP